MAEDKIDGREVTWRQLLPWTELFRGFQVAFDLNKLLLAAAGILVMAFGWWLLAVMFTANTPNNPPDWPGKYKESSPDPNVAWQQFKHDRDEWNLMYETAGVGEEGQKYDVLDLASSRQEYEDMTEALQRQASAAALTELQDENKISEKDASEALRKNNNDPQAALAQLQDEKKLSEQDLSAALKKHKSDIKVALADLQRNKIIDEQKARIYEGKYGKTKPYARLSTGPWSEDRGPNPYLLVTGQAGVPWQAGRFWDWLLRDQLLVMIEPLVKFVQPIVYFFSPRSTGYTSFYFLCIMLWTLATWALFGGAITRIAAVQVTRGEKIGLREALRFTAKRILSYLMAPLFPMIFVFVVLIFMVLFGVVHMIPVFGDIVWDGLLWWLMLICGLVMAVTLVGLVGWPLMSATISTEGTDSWEAVSRSYSYVYQKPWHYIWYSLVAIAYGGILLFFVGFMGSLTAYLAKWGVSKTPTVSFFNREPTYLFVYAPRSFGWRTLLLEGATVHGDKVVDNGQINKQFYDDYLNNPRSGTDPWKGDEKTRDREVLHGWNKLAAILVAIWLGLVFLLMLGFGYSYFWSASTIIYLLMRRHVDKAEMDEVYLEEDEQEGPYGTHFAPPIAPPSSAVKPPSSVTMVEPPTLRTPPTPTAATPPPEPAPSPEPPSPPNTPPPPTEGESQ